jgi:DNA-binding NtrC family response regulator
VPEALIVDDHDPTAKALAALVHGEGFTASISSDLDEAQAHLAQHAVDVILLDLRLPDGDGLALLDNLDPASAPAVVLITGEASVESAVRALRRGVTDYMTKPVDVARLKNILKQVAGTGQLGRELRQLATDATESLRFGHVVGASPQMREVFELITRIAPSSGSVLIIGESGTGKEVVARTIHDVSRRRHGPFVAVNCGAVTPTLMESELFGHERGAFTGAERRHRGMFERAHQGTLFLDEITEMPIELQVKLLRALEGGSVQRVGGEDTTNVDVRVLAATNRSPESALEAGKLRQDLYYRLKVFQVALLPLSSRPDDIDALTHHFLKMFTEEEGYARRITPAALDVLRKHSWPGNVRELRNVLYSAFVLSDEEITPSCLPPEIVFGKPAISGDSITVRVGTPLAEVQKRLIVATLAKEHGNKTRTAKTLGISLKTLYARLAQYKSRRGDRQDDPDDAMDDDEDLTDE